MKDLEHNDFPVRKKKKKKKKRLKPQSKRIGHIRKLSEDFCMNLGWKIIKEKEHLHYANVSVFIKFAKYRRYLLRFCLITVSSPLKLYVMDIYWYHF